MIRGEATGRNVVGSSVRALKMRENIEKGEEDYTISALSQLSGRMEVSSD